jgi:hypothetical protein
MDSTISPAPVSAWESSRASLSAVLAPIPRIGIIEWMASPSRVMLVGFQASTGTLVRIGRRDRVRVGGRHQCLQVGMPGPDQLGHDAAQLDARQLAETVGEAPPRCAERPQHVTAGVIEQCAVLFGGSDPVRAHPRGQVVRGEEEALALGWDHAARAPPEPAGDQSPGVVGEREPAGDRHDAGVAPLGLRQVLPPHPGVATSALAVPPRPALTSAPAAG